MIRSVKVIALSGAVAGLLSVVLGAFAAHSLKGVLSEDSMRIYRTAVDYQSLHALALLCSAALFSGCVIDLRVERWLKRSGAFFIIGLVLFCGSLYLLSFTALKVFGVITPLGGLAFILGWISLFTAIISIPTDSN